MTDSPLTVTADSGVVCPRCGQAHQAVRLRRREQALCIRCAAVMRRSSFLGPEAPFAFAIASLVLAFPVLTLPLFTLSKFGNRHDTYLLSGVEALWRDALFSLSVLVFLTMILAPLALAAALVAIRVEALAPLRGRIGRVLELVEYWAMPEIYLLGILVAFVKLGTLVDVSVQAGMWCFAAMTLSTLCAWWTDRAQCGTRRYASGVGTPPIRA